MYFVGHSVSRPCPANAAKRAIEEFERNGQSGPHSAKGDLLAPVLNYCVAKGIPFELRMCVKGRAMVWRLDAKTLEREAK